MRTVPHDDDAGQRTQAALDAFGWSYATLIYENDDEWAIGLHKGLTQVLGTRLTHVVPISATTQQEEINRLASAIVDSHYRVVIPVLNKVAVMEMGCQALMSNRMNVAGWAILALDAPMGCHTLYPLKFAGTVGFTMWGGPDGTALDTQYWADVNNPASGEYCGPEVDHKGDSYSRYLYDGVYAVAHALHAVLTDCGGALTCSMEPGSDTFQRALRQQLYAQSFVGVTGPLSFTQCSGADFAQNSLGFTAGSSSITCGDRVEIKRSFLNWNGSEYILVGTSVQSSGGDIVLNITKSLIIWPGGQTDIPKDYDPPAAAEEDWWNTSWGLTIVIGGPLSLLLIATYLYWAGKLWFQRADDEAKEAQVRKKGREKSDMLGVSLNYLLHELEDDADAAARHGITHGIDNKKLYNYDEMLSKKLEEPDTDEKKIKEAKDLAKHQQAAEKEIHQTLLIKKLEEALGDKKKAPDELKTNDKILEARVEELEAAMERNAAELKRLESITWRPRLSQLKAQLKATLEELEQQLERVAELENPQAKLDIARSPLSDDVANESGSGCLSTSTNPILNEAISLQQAQHKQLLEGHDAERSKLNKRKPKAKLPKPLIEAEHIAQEINDAKEKGDLEAAAHDDEGEQLRKLKLEGELEKVKILIAKHQQVAKDVDVANEKLVKAKLEKMEKVKILIVDHQKAAKDIVAANAKLVKAKLDKENAQIEEKQQRGFKEGDRVRIKKSNCKNVGQEAVVVDPDWQKEIWTDRVLVKLINGDTRNYKRALLSHLAEAKCCEELAKAQEELDKAQDKQTRLRDRLRAESNYVEVCKETKETEERLDPNFYHIKVTPAPCCTMITENGI